MAESSHTIQEHMRRANWAWDRVRANVERIGVPVPMLDVMRAELRRDAVKFSPFYPLVEARRGAPF